MIRLIHASLVITAAIFYSISAVAPATSSGRVAPPASRQKSVSRPGATLPFTATAYCRRGVTRSGVNTHAGIAAADPDLLPVGSVVHVETDMRRYNGIYTVLDTGAKVQGHELDLFMHNCDEAQRFGRQSALVTVLRKGWSPKASATRAVGK